MNLLRRNVMTRVIITAGALGLGAPTHGQTIVQGTGSDVAGVQGVVDSYRNLLGNLNPNTPGSFPNGRREINWDAVPDTFSDPNAFPGNFLNAPVAPRARGAEFSTPGTSLLLSANVGSPGNAATNFADFHPSHATSFAPFSPQRLFTSLGSNIVDVHFFVPGTTTPALTNGFGAVFSDVDLPGFTTIEFFDAADQSVLSHEVPVAGIADASFSFLGVQFPTHSIARVRITTGNSPLLQGLRDNPSAVEFPTDLVVMDDFIFGEPLQIPEPTGVALLFAASIAFAGFRRANRSSC